MATFQEEAEEHLRAMSGHFTALDRGLPPGEAASAVEGAFRATHTLKGAARSVGLGDVESLCQGLESVLSAIKRGRTSLTKEILGRLQEGMDGVARALAGESVPLHEMLARLGALPTQGGEAPRPADFVAAVPVAPPPTASSAAPAGPATIRVDTGRLDELQSRGEDLLAAKLAAEEREREARELVEALAHEHAAGGGGGGSRQPESPAAEAQARALLGRLSRDRRALGAAMDALAEQMWIVRMLPAASVLERLPPMVAELARARGKAVDFVAEGGELEADRKVLEAIKDPLLHLVRNAVDHGIEPPEVRERAGKPRRGRIAVRFAPKEGRRIELCVQDDGAGIDMAGLRSSAVRARILSAEAAAPLPEAAVLDLVFASGVSTSPVITDLSGHGLGMAIVRDRVERLGGEVSVESSPGKGTSVRMILPASIATFRGLLVRAGGQRVLVPIEAVERALRVASEDLASVGGGTAVRWNGRVLAAAPLAALLGWESEAVGPSVRRPCLVLASGDERGAVLVDEVLGEREVLVKELEAPLVRVRHVAGAGRLGGGELALILRPADLLRALREALPTPEPARPAEEAAPAAILVVDDSITTRTMERNLLEVAGYRVLTAADGIEAWTVLKTERFDLVVSDVDMPRMNGFDLTARIRSDPKLAPLPVVLVTALESREDKERGIEVGANAYVIKSGFDQSKLLEIIRRLV